MKQRMRRDWVYPILEDIQAFLEESELPEMAGEISELLERFGPVLLADRRPGETRAPVAGTENLVRFPSRGKPG